MILQGESAQQVIAKLEEGGRRYVRFEAAGGIFFLNPAHVVSVSEAA